MKLVELCVDGNLDDLLTTTQGRLADAYLVSGRTTEARVIAEDLVARHPSAPENIDRFKRHMTEFLTLAAGGPSEYTGREMAAVHKGMRITNTEFDAMVGDIKVSMENVGIARTEMRELLAIIESTRKQIVEKP